MIYIYTGGVGSGKSYHAIKDVISYLSDGKYVVANFPVRFSDRELKRGYGKRFFYMEEITIKELIKISIENNLVGREGKALLVIDEAGIFFNSRDWQIKSQERKEWIKFFSQSRKFGFDVIMIAQDKRMIDRQIRDMADYEVKHLRLTNITLFNFIETLFRTKLLWAVYYLNRTTFRGNVKVYFLRKKLANKYDTMKLFDITQVPQMHRGMRGPGCNLWG